MLSHSNTKSNGIRSLYKNVQPEKRGDSALKSESHETKRPNPEDTPLLRQQILILHLANPDLESQTVAWALYDGALPADKKQMQTGDQQEPPYKSVLHAMRDGWFVMQLPQLPYFIHGLEHETAHLPYEFVLERRVEINEPNG